MIRGDGCLVSAFPLDRRWPISEAAVLACTLEASAFKVGNVHPRAAFANMHFGHFVASAMAIREAFSQRAPDGVGRLVLDAVTATRQAAGCNTNLGTLLLLAPLAQAAAKSDETDLPHGVRRVLCELTEQDSALVYQAIRVAQPGGMGRRVDDDVSGPAPDCLVAAMRRVSDVDAVARQYTNDYYDIFERMLPWLQAELSLQLGPLEAISRLQLRCLAHEPDGLIARKLGNSAARQVQELAQELLPSWESHAGPVEELTAVQDFDRYLRSDGNRLNPGTTADLIAATLFAQLVQPDAGIRDVH